MNRTRKQQIESELEELRKRYGNLQEQEERRLEDLKALRKRMQTVGSQMGKLLNELSDINWPPNKYQQ
jgi:predicted  nucleic acid-binding Zn-ribbon protein